MKLALMITALITAWISGVGSAVGNTDQRNGALVLAVVAIMFGLLAVLL